MSSIKILASTTVGLNALGETVYQTGYILTSPYNGHINGGVETAIDGITELEFNLTVQQAVAVKANQETSSTEWSSNDVIGGRI